MRVLMLLLAVAACAPPPPPVEIVGDVGPETLPPPEMICSVEGEESLIYTLRTGEVLDPIPTGRACDYEAWRDYVRLYGERPHGEWRSQSYEDWLRANRPEA